MAQVQKKKKEFTGFPGDLHEDHIKALDEFREIVKTQFLYEEGTNELDQSQLVVNDAFLLRFLRARDFNVKKTCEMWQNTCKWRQENNVDQIINEYEFSELSQVQQFYPHGYHKTDKLGRPIYIERIGSLNLKELFQITSEERLIKYYTQSYEILLSRIFPQCSKAAGKRIDQTLTILDLKGVPMKMINKTTYNFIQLAIKIASDNYPEILGKMFIINAPMLFTGVWQVIKPWLDEKTKNKITIIGGKYKDKLLDFIDIQNLPDFLGGESPVEAQGLLGQNIGPWNPNGKTPLFPGEPNYTPYNANQQQEENKNEDDQDEDDDEEQKDNEQDLESLKNALMNMGVGQSSVQKAPHNPNKYEVTTQNNMMVSDTPLNTQINEDNQEEQDNY